MVSDQYTSLGISVIPILPGSKKPHFEHLKKVGWYDEKGRSIWTPAMKEIPSPKICRSWFGGNGTGIAVIAGAVSGNLVYIDWDNAEIYREWAMDHKSIVNSTAVSKTASGYHVFFRTHEPVGGCDLYYKAKYAGQIRGEGQYVVAPPTLHPSGIFYRWLRHPSDGIGEIANVSEIHLGVQECSVHLLRVDYEIAPVDLSDETILLRVRISDESFQYAWNGEWKYLELPSQSECDLKICRALSFWCGRDPERIDRIYRQSPSYQIQIDKWDSARGESTYGRRTIDFACSSTRDTFKQPRKYKKKWRKI